MARILIIEDEESYRDATSFMLRKEGFEVFEAADGALRTFELLMGNEVAPRREFIMTSSDRLSRDAIDA